MWSKMFAIFWVPASIFCANVQSLRNKSPDLLCYVCTMKTDIFCPDWDWVSQHDNFIGSRFTSWVLNDGQFSHGPHWWCNSTINQLLSPCRTLDAGEKVSLNIRNLESWLFIGCRLWMIMILNHSSSGLNPNPLLLLQLLILMNRFFTPWTPAELLELPF